MNTWQTFQLGMLLIITSNLILEIVNKENMKKAKMSGETYDAYQNPLMRTKRFLQLFTVIYIAFFLFVQLRNW